MAAATTCRACGTEPFKNARFCHSCSSPITATTRPAGDKQVTVLFADVVHSMDIASAVGAERLREVMTELFNRCGAMVQRYSGTVDKFTRGAATSVLVESLLQRGSNADLKDAQAAIERLAAVQTDPGFVLFEIPLLRLQALIAHANGDENGYGEFVDRYRKRTNDVGYERHIAVADAMAKAL